MSDPTLVNPVAYKQAFERIEEDEAKTVAALEEIMVKMAATVYEHTGHAMRAVHAKGHGLVRGELRVLDGLPAQLAQGLFAAQRSFPVLMRFSSPPAELLPDNVSTPRAVAIKVMGVAGARVTGSEGATTQDFLMVNDPLFGRTGPKAFLKAVKVVAATTDRAPGAKEVLSAVLRGTEKVLEAVGGESATLKSLGGHPQTHPLGETFFSQVPCLYGPYMAKFSLAPVSPALMALKDKPLEASGEERTDELRDAISGFFAVGDAGAAEWELRVQLCTDIEKMPIEDASVEWPQELSPFIAVARLRVGPQRSWNDVQSPATEDDLSFNPWHALAAHRPLGSVMRARKQVYAASVRHRGARNGCPVHEPRGVPLDDVRLTARV